jgi:signal transduction histidine kinase
MLRTVNWVARALGFAWIGLLTFVFSPSREHLALPVQAVGYGVAGLGMLAWVLLDYHPRAARYRAVGLPVVLGLIAVATGFTSAAGGDGALMVIYGAVAAMAAGSDTGLAAALAVGAAGILAAEIGVLVFGGGYLSFLGLPAVIASGLLIGRNRGAYRLQAEQSAALLAQRERLETEQRRADLLDERARIAREIHDVLAHSLGALSIQIQAARSVLTDRRDIDHAGELLAAAQRMAAEGLAETRRAVHALRSDTRPLGDELAEATGTYGQRYGVSVSFDTGGDPRPLPPDATVALLRIAQEALVNAAKHAAGQPVAVRLDYGGAGVGLTIRNDLATGDGEPRAARVSTANAGYGLTGMRERLRMLGGTLEAGRRDGQWVVSAQLPGAQAENMAS